MFAGPFFLQIVSVLKSGLFPPSLVHRSLFAWSQCLISQGFLGLVPVDSCTREGGAGDSNSHTPTIYSIN